MIKSFLFRGIFAMTILGSSVSGAGAEETRSAHRAVEIIEQLSDSGVITENGQIVHVILRDSDVRDEHIELLQSFSHLRRVAIVHAGTTAEGLRRLEQLDLEKLESFSVVGSNADRQVTRLVARMPELRSLRLEYVPLDEEVMQAIGQLGQLESLHLRGTVISPLALADISRLESLKFLDLAETELTAEALSQLTSLMQLESLWLSETQVDDGALESVGRLTNLQTLLLNGTHVTDAGMAHLATLDQLRCLRLDGTAVTGAGAAELTELASLESLDLEGTVVGDEVFGLLPQMPQLREARLRGTRVTREACVVYYRRRIEEQVLAGQRLPRVLVDFPRPTQEEVFPQGLPAWFPAERPTRAE